MKLPHIAFNLKTYVAVALIITMGFMSAVIVIGLVVPESTLLKLSGTKSQSESSNDQDSESITGNEQQTEVNTESTDTQQSDQQSTPNTSDANGQSSSGQSTTPTTPNTTAPSSPATPSTPTASGTAPSLTFSASPTSITSGGTSLLSWSIGNGATQPVTCTASGGWSGSKATSGSQSVSPSSTTNYSLVCANSAGSSGTKTVSVTVTAPPVSCGPGGTCSASDVASHNTNGNCWVAVTGTGYNKVYVITSSFNSSHVADNGKNAASAARTCGKVISINTLKGYAGAHTNGSKIGGSSFDTWMNSFYYANYQ